jgi:prefoldin subunit 5
MSTPTRKKPFGKVTLTFTSIIVCLLIAIILLGSTLSTRIDALQSANSQLQDNYDNLQTQYNQLNSQYQELKTKPTPTISANSDTAQLQSQITSLQKQLTDATALIAELQGPTGILPTYMSLKYEGPVSSGGSYFLQISLKNTGEVAINQILVTIKSEQISMPFTYLDKTVSTTDPLPAFQIATGRQDVTPPINNAGTYPLVIQALATNGTIYTYQTTITNQ